MWLTFHWSHRFGLQVYHRLGLRSALLSNDCYCWSGVVNFCWNYSPRNWSALIVMMSPMVEVAAWLIELLSLFPHYIDCLRCRGASSFTLFSKLSTAMVVAFMFRNCRWNYWILRGNHLVLKSILFSRSTVAIVMELQVSILGPNRLYLTHIVLQKTETSELIRL